ncbi:hypothetical protein BH23CHL5_BH23CHL5_15980 [soil metagenome]
MAPIRTRGYDAVMECFADQLGVSTPTLIGIAFLLIVQFALMLVALLDLARRDEVVGGKKWLWLLLILLANIVGPIIYLGRNVPPSVDAAPEPHPDAPVPRDVRIRHAVQMLYADKDAP